MIILSHLNTYRVLVVIPARNEENAICRTINGLLSQTIPPELIIIVDDGSKDKTVKKIQEMTYKQVVVLERKNRIGGPSLLGTPFMAQVFNVGFKYIKDKKISYDYIMISGADSLYKNNYIESLIFEFNKDKQLVVTSGKHVNEQLNPDHVMGSGRMISKKFWEYYGGEYPFPSYLWESGIIYTAQMLGLKVKSFSSIKSITLRQGGTNIDMFLYGYILRAIKYPFLITIGRAFKIGLKNNFRQTIRFLAGYFVKPRQRFQKDQEISQYLAESFLQRKLKSIINKILS